MISEELHNVIAWYYRITRGPESLSFAFFTKETKIFSLQGIFACTFHGCYIFPLLMTLLLSALPGSLKYKQCQRRCGLIGFCALIKVNALRSYQPQNFDKNSDSKSGPSLAEIFSAPELINIVLVRS